MHWESYYVNPKEIQGHELSLRGNELHHLASVKRKKKGDIIWAVDGNGGAYQIKILYIARNEARCQILQTRRRLHEPVAEITLAQTVMKGDRFDWLVEKTTEIGIHRIIPLISHNMVQGIGNHKINRWRRVALSAMKQSGRSILPEVTEPKTLSHVLSLGEGSQYKIMAHETGERSSSLIQTMKSSQKKTKGFILIGPEGGFNKQEINQAQDHGYHLISLGPRRLRAETAGMVMVTILLSMLAEME